MVVIMLFVYKTKFKLDFYYTKRVRKISDSFKKLITKEISAIGNVWYSANGCVVAGAVA